MKKQTKSSKTQPHSTSSTSAPFAKWLRSIPQRSDGKVTIQLPISLSPSQWAMLAVDAARRGVTLDQSLQSSVNTFVDIVQDDLGKAA